MKFLRTCSFSMICFLSIFAVSGQDETGIHYVDEYISFTRIAKLPLHDLPKREAWQKAAPGVVEISIPRDDNEPEQPALWYH